jgi:hypothetical protein
MACIWGCEASVTLNEPMNVPGYPQSTEITVRVKVRTESEKDPPDSSIIEAARRLMDACYPIGVVSIQKPTVNFLLHIL